MSNKNTLGFHWIAKYSDDSIISQFDGDSEQHHFGHIWGPKSLRDPKDLVEFQLISSANPNVIHSVNLKDGVFRTNGEEVHRPQFDFSLPADQSEVDMSDVKIKLVYWRRTRQHLFADVGMTIRHLFGYIISYRGSDVKIIMAVGDDKLETVGVEEMATIQAVPNTEPVPMV
jgi:hypothetical protein